MKIAATLSAPSSFFHFAPTAPVNRAARRPQLVRVLPAPAPRPAGLFSRLEAETAAGSGPETVVFAILALTGAAWPTYEALRLIAGF